MQIDWQFLIGSALASLGGLGTVAAAAWFAWIKLRRGKTADSVKAAERSADQEPPEGAIEWVADITRAMGGASAESVLLALVTGYTRAEAQQMRIAELEKKP